MYIYQMTQLSIFVLEPEDTNDENHRGTTGEWDGRRRNAAAAAASRRRAKQRRETQATNQGIGGSDGTNAVNSIANKPPQDRPDAKHHLKVQSLTFPMALQSHTNV